MGPACSIRQKHKDFPKVNKKIIDYILKDPTRLLSLTVDEIANNDETSLASVTRFSKRLGLDSWRELKLSIVAVQAAGNGRKDIDPIITADNSMDTICMKVESLLNAMIENLFCIMGKRALEQAIMHAKRAGKIHLVGVGAFSLTTYNPYYKLNRTGHRAIFNYDSHMMLEFLNYVTAQDILITVFYSDLTKEALVICEITKSRGATVILITSNDGENVRSLSDEAPLVPNNEYLIRVGATLSIASSMAIGDVLYSDSIQDDLDTKIERNMIEMSQPISRLKEKQRCASK